MCDASETQAAAINKDQLDVIATAMDQERGIVAKFKELRCDKYMETESIVERAARV